MKRSLYFLILLFLLGCSTYHKVGESNQLMTIQITDQNGLSETISTKEKLEKFQEIDFTSPQPYKKVLRIFQKDKEEKCHSVITSYHENGQVEEYLEGTGTRALGKYRKFYDNGKMQIEASIIGGSCDLSFSSQKDWQFDGICKKWDREGNLIAAILYDKGKIQGDAVYYFSDGSIQKTIPYNNDEIDGKCFIYYPSGKILEEITYKNGILDGVALKYYETGQKQSEEIFVKGQLDNAGYFDSDGNHLSKVEKGRGKKSFFDQGILTKQIEVQKGALNGEVTIFHTSGQIHKSYRLKDGKKQGLEIEYFLKEELLMESEFDKKIKKLEVLWDDDTIHGQVKTWYNQGMIRSEVEMYRNKKNGMYLSWYRNGSLMLMEEYEEDNLVKGSYFKKNQEKPISQIKSGTGIAYLYEGDGTFIRKIKYIKGKIIE